MQKHFLHVRMLETQERQFFKAVNGPDGYEEGMPYPFEVPEDVEAAHDAEMARRKAQGGVVMMNVPAPFGLFPRPPPKNKTLRATIEEDKYDNNTYRGRGAGKQKYAEACSSAPSATRVDTAARSARKSTGTCTRRFAPLRKVARKNAMPENQSCLPDRC